MTDKQAQLAWLDKQISIVNDMIINLPPDEQWQLLPELQVINAIAERVREMSAVEFVEACEEICAGRKCYNCPLNIGFCPAHGIRLAVEIVKRWKEEQS